MTAGAFRARSWLPRGTMGRSCSRVAAGTKRAAQSN